MALRRDCPRPSVDSEVMGFLLDQVYSLTECEIEQAARELGIPAIDQFTDDCLASVVAVKLYEQDKDSWLQALQDDLRRTQELEERERRLKEEQEALQRQRKELTEQKRGLRSARDCPQETALDRIRRLQAEAASARGSSPSSLSSSSPVSASTRAPSALDRIFGAPSASSTSQSASSIFDLPL